MKNFSLFLVLSTISLLFSCSTEQVQMSAPQTQSINNAKIWFEKYRTENDLKIIEYAKSIEWDNAIVSNGSRGEIIEVPYLLKDNYSSSISNAKKTNNNFHRLLFVKDGADSFKLNFIDVFTNDSFLSTKEFNYYNVPDKFIGAISVFDVKNKSAKLFNHKIDKGKRTKSTSKTLEAYCNVFCRTDWDGNCQQILWVNFCYNIDKYGTGEEEYGSSGDLNGEGGDAGSNTSNGSSIENLIAALNLNPCSESALNKLKAATGVDIASIMNKFNSSTVYNVTIKTSPTSLGTSVAQTNFTNPAIPYDYTINISPDYSESTELFRAATLLHEITHAYFLSLWNDFNAGIQPGSNVYNDNATLFQLYVTHTYPSSNSFDAHHEEMAKTYINSIASALQEFQTGIPVILAGTPNQIYTDLAWGGLKDTPIYNSTFPIGSAERQRIENRYACEQVGHPVGYGTAQQQNTIGNPCQ